MSNTMLGIDISNHQEGIDLYALNIDFCICKATEGLGFVDRFCDGFIQDCKKLKIKWGFYHFARENDAKKEAKFFYDNCKNYFGKGIPILDWEVETSVKWCEEFIKELHRLSGIWCMIYMSASKVSQFNGSWIPEKCGLWVAGYPQYYSSWTKDDMPYDISPWKFAAIWQFTDTLIIHGFWEKLDGDIAYMNESAWDKYAQIKENKDEKPVEKSLDDLVLETLLGEYGNGSERKKMLGDKYLSVQRRINELYTVAYDVIDGKWGNGWNREQALNGAGYPYKIVQKIVNEILA